MGTTNSLDFLQKRIDTCKTAKDKDVVVEQLLSELQRIEIDYAVKQSPSLDEKKEHLKELKYAKSIIKDVLDKHCSYGDLTDDN